MRSCILLMLFCGVSIVSNAQWKKVFIPTVKDLYDVQILDNYGYAVGNNSALLKSTDSGKSWKNLTLTIPTNLKAVCFLDTNIGLVTGENARIQKTIDGGKNWTQKYIRTAAYGYGMAFRNNDGIVVGKDMLAVSSNDYGETWKVDTTLQKFKNLNSVMITPDGDCWAVGDSGYILNKNISSGKWKISKYPTKVNLNHVSYAGNNTIVITGGMADSAIVGKFYNILLMSTDSGKTWKQNTLGEMKIVFSAYFKNGDTGFLAGSNGLISKCSSGISNRGLQLTGTSSSLNKIFFSGNTGIVVGDGGTLLRTVNDGGNALSQKMLFNDRPSMAIFPNPSSGNFSVQTDAGSFDLKIYNYLGRLVYTDPDYTNGKMVSFGRSGVFFVQLSDKKGNAISKQLIVSAGE